MHNLFWMLSAVVLLCGCRSMDAGALKDDVVPSKAPVPLFAAEDVVAMTLTSDFPYGAYQGQPHQDDYPKFAGTLSYDWNGHTFTHKVKVQARGSGRLSHCAFAPFKIDLKGDLGQSLMEGITSDMKVVTHCDGAFFPTTEKADEVLLKEYLLYKILRAFGIPEFDVRLIKMRYLTPTGALVADRYAFFIEPKENLVTRYPSLKSDADEAFLKGVFDGLSPPEIEKKIADLIDLPGYVMSNLGQLLLLNDDWGGLLVTGNAKSFVTDTGKVFKVHYDFDIAALTGKVPFGTSFHGYTYPATVASDRAWIEHFCGTAEQYVDAAATQLACNELRPKLAANAGAALAAVDGFPFLSTAQKSEIRQRVATFFQALAPAAP